MATLIDLLTAFWLVTTQMAPWLLLGFLIAGLLSVYVSPVWLQRHLGGKGLRPVWKAAVLGVPLPLCSCGVIPVGASLRRHGASRAAVTSFLISTPQTGVDSIAVTGALLGPVYALLRPLIALLTGVLGGALVRIGEKNSMEQPVQAAEDPQPAPHGRIAAALRYGFETLPRDIGKTLLIGLTGAALITALVPAGALSGLLGGGLLPILAMMAVSIPVYFCATGSVPLVAGLLHAGVSPGAALTLLIAGPTTNAAMTVMLVKILGRRAAMIHLATVAGSAVAGGLALDAVLAGSDLQIPALHMTHCHESIGLLRHLGAGLLVVNLAWVFGRRRPNGSSTARSEVSGPAGQADGGLRITLRVDGMRCAQCQRSIETALGRRPGITQVAVDLERGRVAVHGSGIDARALIADLDALGYAARIVT